MAWQDVPLVARSRLQQVKWRNVFVGNEGDESFFDMFLLDDGHVVVGGYYRDVFAADGCDPHPAAGGNEAVLLKRKP